MKILRSIGAIIAGLATATALIIFIEMVATYFHPFPVGSDTIEQSVM